MMYMYASSARGGLALVIEVCRPDSVRTWTYITEVISGLKRQYSDYEYQSGNKQINITKWTQTNCTEKKQTFQSHNTSG